MRERLYLDTEFNGFGGSLISMALVGDDISWYQAQEINKPYDQWVKEHVAPKLLIRPLTPVLFRKSFQQWICGFDNPEIICDWPVDAQHFCSMLAGVDYGSSLDFACNITILKTPKGHPVSVNTHNALADATALRDWHLSMVKV